MVVHGATGRKEKASRRIATSWCPETVDVRIDPIGARCWAAVSELHQKSADVRAL